jgi:hypothetical protein
MKVLRPHVDDELVTIELDVEALNVAADGISRFEHDNVAGAIEEPRQRHARHSASDDPDEASPDASRSELLNGKCSAGAERA